MQPISNQRMKYGSLTRLLTVLALPIFIDTLLVMTLGAADTYSLSMVVVTYFINFLGNDELATRTYGQTITTFVFLFSLAAAQGGAIVIGHLTGMKKYNAAFALGRRVLRISVAVTFVLSFTTACFGHTIFSMLTDNENIIRMGTIVLWIDIMVEVGRALFASLLGMADKVDRCDIWEGFPFYPLAAYLANLLIATVYDSAYECLWGIGRMCLANKFIAHTGLMDKADVKRVGPVSLKE